MVNVDIDPANQKTEREEWGTAKYHGNYNPTAAFELELQYLVATGAVVGDLVRLSDDWFRERDTDIAIANAVTLSNAYELVPVWTNNRSFTLTNWIIFVHNIDRDMAQKS